MTNATMHAPTSGRPFENMIAGLLLGVGFLVDVDVLWTIAGQGDVAQFDLVASGLRLSGIHRVIVECKGGDRWGFGDAFQLLGAIHAAGESGGVLFVAERRSIARASRSSAAIDEVVGRHGVHVVGVPVDDRAPSRALYDQHSVLSALWVRGLVPMLDVDTPTDDIDTFARGVARLRGALDRVGAALSHPMSPVAPPAAMLVRTVRDWMTVCGDPTDRLTAVRSILVPSLGSQEVWLDDAKVERFGRDVAIIEAYAGAQEVAAVAEALRIGWTLPRDWGISREFRGLLPTLDLHAMARGAYVLALVSPMSSLAAAVRGAYGPIIASVTSSKKLRQRCREPRAPRLTPPRRRRPER